MSDLKTAIAGIALTAIGGIIPVAVPKIMAALGIGKYKVLVDRVYDAVNETVVESNSPIARSQVYELIKVAVAVYTEGELPDSVKELLVKYLTRKFNFETAIEEQAAKIPEEKLKENLDTAIATFKEKQAAALLGTKPASL